jgi:small multidrug resistance pump
MKYWFFLAVAITAEVIGTSSLKASESFTKLVPSVVFVVSFVVAFYFLSLTLKAIPVGVAYAVWSGMGIVLISLIGLFVFDQKLDTPAIIGLVFIVAGVLIMQLFSKSIAH